MYLFELIDKLSSCYDSLFIYDDSDDENIPLFDGYVVDFETDEHREELARMMVTAIHLSTIRHDTPVMVVGVNTKNLLEEA